MLTILFSSVAALIQAIAQLYYIYNLVSNKIILSKATWFVSAFIVVLSASSYYSVVAESSPIIALSTITVAISFIFIFSFSLFTGKFAKVDRIDVVGFFLSLGIIVVWRLTDNAELSNLLLQIVWIIIFTPTIIGLLQGRLKEKPLPWVVGIVASALVMGAVYTASGLENIVGLLYPFVVGVLLNGVIGLLAYLQQRGVLKSP